MGIKNNLEFVYLHISLNHKYPFQCSISHVQYSLFWIPLIKECKESYKSSLKEYQIISFFVKLVNGVCYFFENQVILTLLLIIFS